MYEHFFSVLLYAFFAISVILTYVRACVRACDCVCVCLYIWPFDDTFTIPRNRVRYTHTNKTSIAKAV